MILTVLVVIFTLILIYKPLFRGLSYLLQGVGSFVWQKGDNLSPTESDRLQELEAKLSLHETILHENILLKEIFFRAEKNNLILGAILSKPNRSLYDTLIIDLGKDDGVMVGNSVFAYGDVLIGKIDEVFKNTSRVKLFSSPGENTDALVSVTTKESDLDKSDIFIQTIGRGGQNFEITVPQNLIIEIGTEVITPGVKPYVIGIVEKIISDPRDPFQKILLRSPINIQDIKFVEVENHE